VYVSSLLTRIERGFSGTWVVADGESIGMIVAVYDNQPYVHMIPMASIFQSIRRTLRQRSEDSEVRMLSPADAIEPELVSPKAQPHVAPAMTKPRHSTLPLLKDLLPVNPEKEKKDDLLRPSSVTEPSPPGETLLQIVRKLPKGLFVPICLMVLAIGLVSLAFLFLPTSQSTRTDRLRMLPHFQ
jgi:hypothetical protein